MNQYQIKLRNKKNEQFIKDLIKVEENNKCFDCTSNKITHVNLSINTFVCSECEGFLREINHRIKSISLSTFSPEELYNLQNGGNKKAKKIWLAKWKDSYEELNHEKHDNEKSKKFIRNKYVRKKWFVAPNEIEIDPPKLEKEIIRKSNPIIIDTKSIEIKSKSKRESLSSILSKSLNELEIFNRHKSNKRLSKQSSIHSPKQSPIRSPKQSPIRSPITNSDAEIDILNQTFINLQNINPYLPLDDEDDEDDYRTLSMETSNTTAEKSIFKRTSLDFFNLNKTLNRKTVKNNNNNNNNSKRFSLTTKIPTNNNYIKNKENINNNFHHNNDFYENDISNNKQYKIHNYFNQDNCDNHKIINGNDNNLNDILNNKYNTKTESKEKLKKNPVYAPRSSSLLNKALIEKVCNTKNCYFIDNKKVYCYDKHSKQLQMQY